jgi:hypothetical protein
MSADTLATERPLGLHQITVMEAGPPELVSIAVSASRGLIAAGRLVR